MRRLVAMLAAAAAAVGAPAAVPGSSPARSGSGEVVLAERHVICYSDVILGHPTGDICVPWPF